MSKWIVALTAASLGFAVTSALAQSSKPKVTPGIRQPVTPGKGAAGATPSNATKLAPDAIKSTFFTGQPFTASTPAGIKFKMTFTADGKMTREPVGKSGVKDQGVWSTNNDGFCTTWARSKQNCYKLFARNDNTWSVSNGSATLATWSKE